MQASAADASDGHQRLHFKLRNLYVRNFFREKKTIGHLTGYVNWICKAKEPIHQMGTRDCISSYITYMSEFFFGEKKDIRSSDRLRKLDMQG